MDTVLTVFWRGIELATFVGVCTIVYQLDQMSRAAAKGIEAADELFESAGAMAAKLGEAFATASVEPPDTFDPREEDGDGRCDYRGAEGDRCELPADHEGPHEWPSINERLRKAL